MDFPVFPVRDAGLIDLIPQLPGQDPESIRIQGGRFRTLVAVSRAVDPVVTRTSSCAVRCPVCCASPVLPRSGAERRAISPAATAHTASTRRRSSAPYRVTVSNSSSECALHLTIGTSTAERSAIASRWDCCRVEKVIPESLGSNKDSKVVRLNGDKEFPHSLGRRGEDRAAVGGAGRAAGCIGKLRRGGPAEHGEQGVANPYRRGGRQRPRNAPVATIRCGSSPASATTIL